MKVTRLELSAAAAAVILLGALGVWAARGDSGKQRDVAMATARRVVTAALEWKQEHGDIGCPTLSQLIRDRNWDERERADDPWGGRFLISCSSDEVRVRSAGGDGQFETEDDVALALRWNS